MIAINETKFGAALGTVLNEVGKSPEMREKLKKVSNDYSTAAEYFPSESKEYNILDNSARRSAILASQIGLRRSIAEDNHKDTKDLLKYQKNNYHGWTNVRYPERVEARIKNANEAKEKFAQTMLQRVQGGKRA